MIFHLAGFPSEMDDTAASDLTFLIRLTELFPATDDAHELRTQLVSDDSHKLADYCENVRV